MKTTKICKPLLLIVMLSLSAPSFAEVPATTVNNPPVEQRMAELQNRLEEIRAMDTKAMTRDQKKALRTEIKQIKKEMKEVSGGVYLSVGAIIIIALLLILLL